jgi:hypothetical protein
MRRLLVVLALAATFTGCTKTQPEVDTDKNPERPAPQRDAIRRKPIAGTIGKTLCDVSMKDMQAAVKAAGWTAAGYTEATSAGTVTRNFPVQRQKLTGAVTWYKTSDKDMIHATVVMGWPSAEDGDCILSVRTTDDNKRDEARRLLNALVGD